MLTYAHRGIHTSGIAQNSMEAFRLAASEGYGIETDLRTTSDGVVVLFHDRCAASRPIDAMTHHELESAVGRNVPTLDQLIQADLGVPINLDVKTNDAFIRALDAMLAARGRITLVSAFRHDVAVAAAAAGLPSAYLMASSPPCGDPMPARRRNLTTVVFDYDVIDGKLIERAVSAGMDVVSYGALTGSEHDRLKVLGVTASITDSPQNAEGTVA